jgi:hypothetical protein
MAATSRTAVYGPVRTVVWQGSAGNRCPYADQIAESLSERSKRTKEPDSLVPGGSRATRTLLSSVWAAAAVPASVLTAARKLKYSWILARFSGLIRFATRKHALSERLGAPPDPSALLIYRNIIHTTTKACARVTAPHGDRIALSVRLKDAMNRNGRLSILSSNRTALGRSRADTTDISL